MILKAKNGGQWSPVAVFNATTSGFNFMFNILDMMMPLEDEKIEKRKKYDIEENIESKEYYQQQNHIKPKSYRNKKKKTNLPLTTMNYEFTLEDKMLESDSIEMNDTSSSDDSEVKKLSMIHVLAKRIEYNTAN